MGAKFTKTISVKKCVISFHCCNAAATDTIDGDGSGECTNCCCFLTCKSEDTSEQQKKE